MPVGTGQTYNATDAAYGGKPSIALDGTGGLVTASVLPYGPFTYFIAAKFDGIHVGYVATHNDAFEYLFGTTGFSIFTGGRTSSNGTNLTPNWSVSAAPRTIVHIFDGTAAGEKIRINGVEQTQSPIAPGDPGTDILSKLFSVFGNTIGASPSSGTIAEVVVYDNSVSAPNMALVETYLQTKYGYY